MTKHFYWQEICLMAEEADEALADYFAAMEDEDETSVDWFPDRRIDHTGYEEFDCSLCGRPNDRDALHAGCKIEQRARGEAIDEYYWERSSW